MGSKGHHLPKDRSLWGHSAAHFCQALWTPFLATKDLCQEGKGHSIFVIRMLTGMIFIQIIDALNKMWQGLEWPLVNG